MIRVEALLLLKEIAKAFESIENAKLVALLEKESDRWLLCSKWIVGESEKDRLKSIACKHNAQIFE
jgi:hypothetical protein